MEAPVEKGGALGLGRETIRSLAGGSWGLRGISWGDYQRGEEMKVKLYARLCKRVDR